MFTPHFCDPNPLIFVRTVGDHDLVQLSAIRFEGADSAGATTCDSAGAVFDEANGVCIPLPPFAIRGGPRSSIYFDPGQVTAAVVTCGGLCPGLNDVVQNIVFTLLEYGVPDDQVGSESSFCPVILLIVGHASGHSIVFTQLKYSVPDSVGEMCLRHSPAVV